MSDDAKLIDPSGIPHFIGDLGTLDTDVMLLTADAGQFRASGADVHTEFQGLSAFYEAPEAEQLFATTLPVKQKSDAFADDLEKVATALSDYSFEVQPLARKLDTLKSDATAFVNSVSGDDDWRKDQDKVDHNNDLWHDVNHTVAAFQDAERTAYNKIMALIGGTRMGIDDGSGGKNKYGYRAEDLDHAEATPWGAPAEREYEGWAWLAHQGKQVWDGVWQDGVIGTIHGVGTLFGSDGWDAAGEAWKNLAKLSTASALTSVTMGTWWLLPEDKQPSWLRDSRKAYKETAKGFIAYDQWKTNPARAAGAVGFNVLTIVGTEGAGSAVSGAGKAGAAARTLSLAGKVGRAIDPMTYAGKAAKFAFVRVGDTFTTLKNLHTGAYADMADLGGRYAPAEHPLRVGERPASVPEGAVEYVDARGTSVYLTPDGHVLGADGSVRQEAHQAAGELSADDRAALVGRTSGESASETTRTPALTGAHSAATSSAENTVDGARGPETGFGHQASSRNLPQARRVGEVRGFDTGSAGRSDAQLPGGDRGWERTGSDGTPDSARRAEDDAQPDHSSENHPEHLSPAEKRTAAQAEHVRKANDDQDWFKKHYDKIGRRRPHVGQVDGFELPQIAKDAQERWVAKHDLPNGPSEVRLNRTQLDRNTAPEGKLPHLDKSAADRQAYRDLMNAQRAYESAPSDLHHSALIQAQADYVRQLGTVTPNSKISEIFGEMASRMHGIPHQFPDATPIDLPKTSNGANAFDAAYRLEDDGILIVEDKAPANDLDWRHGRADPEDPTSPERGDDGGAAGMRVKQGTRQYLRTIFAEMSGRGGLEEELAQEFRNALRAQKLRYVLVRAQEPHGPLYAGVIVEHFKVD
ncbi:hypothetical protein ACPCIU_08660 [Streptomyces seoulensis]|uniref:hypothetical protein n=1 Tax=Streptomyces seoulensis TaxID=73044 RepID=UPI003C2BC575